MQNERCDHLLSNFDVVTDSYSLLVVDHSGTPCIRGAAGKNRLASLQNRNVERRAVVAGLESISDVQWKRYYCPEDRHYDRTEFTLAAGAADCCNGCALSWIFRKRGVFSPGGFNSPSTKKLKKWDYNNTSRKFSYSLFVFRILLQKQIRHH